VRKIKFYGGEIIAMALLSDGMSLAERWKREIKIWNVRSGELLKTLERSSIWSLDIAFIGRW
jgi:hypothetical protein